MTIVASWELPVRSLLRLQTRRMLVGLACALAVSGCRTESHEPADTDASVRPISVTYIVADLQIVEAIEESVATVRPKHAPRLAIEVDGAIERVLVDEGDQVEEGDLLALIEQADYEIAHRRAEAKIRRLGVLIEQKQREIERLERLHDGGHTPESQLEEARSERAVMREELASVRADRERAERDLNRTAVHAPYEGRIARRHVSMGDYVEAGTVLFEMTANSLLQVRIPLPEAIGSRLKVGQEVRLVQASAPDSEHIGHLAQVSPQVDGASRSVTAIAELDNPADWRAGTSLNATVILDERESVVVPEESVVRRPAGLVAYVVDGNTVRERPVRTGRHTADGIEILDGIQPDDRVVVHGAGFLSDRAEIDPAPHGAEVAASRSSGGMRPGN